MPGVNAAAAAMRDAVVAALAAAGRPAFTRVLLSDGADVAYDCEQLVVAVESIRSGLPGEAGFVYLDARLAWTAVLAVHALRCAPTMDEAGEAPTAASITASAAAIQGDASALLNGARDFARVCKRAATATLTFPGPNGGYAVALLRVEVLLD